MTSSLTGDTARVTCGKAMRGQLASELARHGVAIEELHTVRASLEDAFLALMGASAGDSSARPTEKVTR